MVIAGNDIGMSDALTYSQALSILGRTESRLASALAGAVAVGSPAWVAGGVSTGSDVTVLLGLPELTNDVIKYADQIGRKVTEWRKNVSRFDHSQRLAALHAILVVSSYFAALDDAHLGTSLEKFRLTDSENAAVVTNLQPSAAYLQLIELLLREPLPLPEPHRSSFDIYEQLTALYRRMSTRVQALISDHPAWHELSDRKRQHFGHALNTVAAEAVAVYKERYGNLTADYGEFVVWARSTKDQTLGTSLSGITSMLSDMDVRRTGASSRSHLPKAYRAALREPVAGPGEAPEGITLPPLGEAYVNPLCRVAEIKISDAPAASEWWLEQESVPDIEAFLAGYLTSLRATNTPLVVLGEPGSGKSKFAEVLAARLTPDFIPVLVSLRDVPAESMVREQIEQAIYQKPGRPASWDDLCETANGALPVVLLDGFDELVQAAAVHRYDYLEQVRDFQRYQAQIGNPVSVVVTSRTVVANYVRFPIGSLVLQLQPFTSDQIRSWLETWSRYNAHSLVSRGLRPLPAEHALAHRELAEQPLLLMMLAIFDTSSNALQQTDLHFSRTELYERLLSDFALREVTKFAHYRRLSAARQREIAERHIQRLAAVAIAMFNRGSQTATEVQLDHDIPMLQPLGNGSSGITGNALTHTQQATGMFFFVYRSEAHSQTGAVRSYEFLHATFGEYLLARTVLSALRSLGDIQDAMRRSPTAAARLDDGYLYAILSFTCLAGRVAVVDFLHELIEKVSHDIRRRLQELLSQLLAHSLHFHTSRSLTEYEPVRRSVTRRLATYSANLMFILVLVAKQISVSDLFGLPEAADRWREYGFLWRSGLTHLEWRALSDSVRARAFRVNGNVDIRLAAEDNSPVSPLDSILITSAAGSTEATQYDVMLAQDEKFMSYDAEIPAASLAGRVFRDSAFLPSWHAGVFLLQSVPIARALRGEVRWQGAEGLSLLPGYLLASLDYGHDQPAEARAQLYGYCLDRMASNPVVLEQLLLRLRRDAAYFSSAVVLNLLRRSNVVAPSRSVGLIISDLWFRSESDDSRAEVARLVGEIVDEWRTVPGLDVDVFS